MATTPNYGWVTPAPTDLVTDLPADFEIFADAVDADLAGLLGGTTGQVLKKTSNADHAFAFGVDPTFDLVTTAGDLVYGTAADTMARLGIGTAGQILAVNSGATAPEWKTVAAGGGKVLQVVSTTTTTTVQVASTSFTDSGLSLSITPSAASSKVLVLVSQACQVTSYLNSNNGSALGTIILVRGATEITSGKLFNAAAAPADNETQLYAQQSFVYLDSPATTSATTYKTRGKVSSTANSQSLGFQRTGDSSTMSSIILLEIGA